MRFDPKLLTVIVVEVDEAVNLYQTPKVVVEVALPHDPVGAALAAFFKLPVVMLQVDEGVNVPAVAQLAWP